MSSVSTVDADMKFLAAGRFVSPEQAMKNPEFHAHILGIAKMLSSVNPESVKGLRKDYKVRIIKLALKLQKDEKLLMSYLDDETASALQEDKEFQKMMTQYYLKYNAKSGELSLNSGSLKDKQIAEILGSMTAMSKSQVVSLDLSHCFYLTSVEFLKDFPNVVDLNLSYTAIASLKGIESLSKLKNLNISDCSGLRSLTGLEGAKNLLVLDASNSTKLEDLEALVGCVSLRELNLNFCRGLCIAGCLAPLGHLQLLERLHLCYLVYLTTLDRCATLRNLTFLDVSESGVVDIRAVATLPKLTLTNLKLKNCDVPTEQLEAMARISKDKAAHQALQKLGNQKEAQTKQQDTTKK